MRYVVTLALTLLGGCQMLPLTTPVVVPPAAKPAADPPPKSIENKNTCGKDCAPKPAPPCLPLPVYSDVKLKFFAIELGELRNAPTIREFLADYIQLRKDHSCP